MLGQRFTNFKVLTSTQLAIFSYVPFQFMDFVVSFPVA